MSWITVIWSMTAAACLTLAAIHFLVWWQRRTAWADLVFTLTSVGVAAFIGFASNGVWSRGDGVPYKDA